MKFLKVILGSMFLFFGVTDYCWAGKACLMITMAAGGDHGELYKIHDTWQPFRISNRDVFKWSGILKEMKGVGCEVVVLDMTNLGQVRIMENALAVRDDLDGMKYANFVTSPSHAAQRDMTIVELANLQAKDTWEMMAQDPTVYEYWGDKPLLIVWADEASFTSVYNQSPPEHKTYIDKFRIGYSESSNNGHGKDHFIKDSFGYRTVGGHLKVRQCAPTFGYSSATWTRKTKAEYRADCEWVKMATDYSVYGSWTLSDGMMMGIANTEAEGLGYKNQYPDTSDPWYYADVLKSVLKGVPIGKSVSLNVPETGKYVSADADNDPAYNPLFANASSAGELETFKILDATEIATENIGIYNESLGTYLRNSGGLIRCSGTNMGGYNRFKWFDKGNGYVSIKSSASGGLFVEVPNGTNQLAATQADLEAPYTTYTYNVVDKRDFISLEHASRRHLALGATGNEATTLNVGLETIDSQWVREYVDGTWFFLRHRTSHALLQNFTDSSDVTAAAPGAWVGSSVIKAQLLWRLVDAGNGWYRVENDRTGRWLSEDSSGGGLAMIAPDGTNDATLWRMVYPAAKGGETHTFTGAVSTKNFTIDSVDPTKASLTTDIVSGDFRINVTFTAESTGQGSGSLKKDYWGNLYITTNNPDFIDGSDALTISYQINWYAGPNRMVIISDGFSGYVGRSITDLSKDGALVSSGFATDAFDSGTVFQSGDQAGGSDPRMRLGTFYFEVVMAEVDVSFTSFVSADDFNITNDASPAASATLELTSEGKTANVTFTVESTGHESGALRVEQGGYSSRAISIASGNKDFIDSQDELTVSYVVNSIAGADGMRVAAEGFTGFVGHSLMDVAVDQELVSSDFEFYPFYRGSRFQAGSQAGGSDPRIRIGGFYFELDLIEDVDRDYDGLPNAWELQYFGGETNANPNSIASNGVNTVMETYIAGLNPTNAESFFRVTPGDPVANGFVLRWNATSGRVYSVHGATNLVDEFQPLKTNILFPQSSWTDTVQQAESFYQIDVQLAD